MRIVFHGIAEEYHNGCGGCGGSRTDSRFVTMKPYILPSGITKTFRAGVPEEVSERDAAFLLLYKRKTPEGSEIPVFEVVD